MVLVGLSLIHVQPADAARGGRMGGGSFRAPSMPRSGGRSYGGGGTEGVVTAVVTGEAAWASPS